MPELIDRRCLLGSAAAFSVLPGLSNPNALASNIEPKSVAEQLLYCTVRIDAVLKDGVSHGTGFIYTVQIDKQGIPLLITNNHVVRKSISTSFKVHTKSDGASAPDGNTVAEAPGDVSGLWTSHPNPKVDLCALPIAPILKSIKPAPFYRSFEQSLIPSETQLAGLDAIEDVIMIGYPIALSDEANNYPIVRRGITASDPAVDFDGESVTVIDMACFPGSSGSPVIIYNNGSYALREGGLTVGSRTILLGVLYAGPLMKIDGSVRTEDVPTSTASVASMNVMVNLGYIIKSKEIEVLANEVMSRFQKAHK